MHTLPSLDAPSLPQSTKSSLPSLAVVVQGPASQDYTLKLLASFSADSPTGCGGADICIFSTWSTEAGLPISLAYKEAGFTLILSHPPAYSGEHNVNLQQITSHAGIVAARWMGATHAIKMRGDIHLNHPTAFIQKVVGYPDKLTTVSWIRYMTDYLVAGPIDALEQLFLPTQPQGDDRFPELFISSEYSKFKNISIWWISVKAWPFGWIKRATLWGEQIRSPRTCSTGTSLAPLTPPVTCPRPSGPWSFPMTPA